MPDSATFTTPEADDEDLGVLLLEVLTGAGRGAKTNLLSMKTTGALLRRLNYIDKSSEGRETRCRLFSSARLIKNLDDRGAV
jgi:hypothetical protein